MGKNNVFISYNTKGAEIYAGLLTIIIKLYLISKVNINCNANNLYRKLDMQRSWKLMSTRSE